jgi:SAM-dependent methyltransferase
MSTRCLACGAATRALFDAWTRCPRCGFVEGARTESAERASYRALHESGTGARVEQARRGVYRPLLERFPPHGGRRCLDVGSGAGVFARLALASGWRSVGIDPAGPALDDGDLRLVRGEFPPAPDGPFELITFFGSLNYMGDPHAALVAARAALAPGGRVVVRVPNVDFHLGVRRLARLIGSDSRPGRWLRRGTILHPRSFSARALRAVLTRAGFRRARVEAARPAPGDPYGTGAAAIAAAKAVVGGVALGVGTLTGHRIVLASTLLAVAEDGGPGGADC